MGSILLKLSMLAALAYSHLLFSAEEPTMNTQSISEGRFITIDDLEQWIVIRGNDNTNPVMLIVSGPGVGLSAIAPFFEAWEEDFTLVHWDQPGSGATYGRNPEQQGALSVDRLVKDGLLVVDYLRDFLNVEKVAVLGISAGSIIGLRMMTEQAEAFSAYVGTGQFVNWAEQDKRGYEMILAQEQARDNSEAIEELMQLGPPPYADVAQDAMKSEYHSALTEPEMAELPVFSSLMAEALTNSSASADYIAQGVALGDPRQLATNAYSTMRAEYMAFDAWNLSTNFSMPMLFLQGDKDVYSVTAVVQEYEQAITAPYKETVILENGSHSVFWQRDVFLEALRQHLIPQITE